ncbi:MAG: hypothetical protein TREMPRED_003399 [Tremellales sp. Tagirdzhanova-0007]|nr:MAG: hypothetical protein TREMPRED_003399 [Tremellales sp. Tagirdzhanova-0007]
MSSDRESNHGSDHLRAMAEKRLVRKVDLLLMPILTVTLGLQYYDKAVLGNAAVFGILADLDLEQTIHGVVTTTRYSTATAAFYYGYIVAVLPMALLFARLPLSKAASAVVLMWGIVCILTTVCVDYPGFVAQRIALGLMESAVSPAFVAVTVLWYKPYEQARRLGIWYSATGIFSMISGICNYGLGHTKMAHPWKALYFFCGSVTIAWAFVIYFTMPTSPLQPGRFFNAEEREILVRRFEENPYGKDRQPFNTKHFIEALLDFKTWIYLLMGASIYICNGAVTAFGARIISGFGYSSLNTTVLLIPGGAMTCVTIYFFTYFADRYRNIRTYLLPLSCIPVMVGALVIWLAPWHPTIGPLMGYYLVASFGAPYVLLLALASSNVIGATKKAVTAGAIFLGWDVGNIAAAYLLFAREKPIKYRSTWISVIVAMVFASCASIFLRVIYIRENKHRDALGAASVAAAMPHSVGEEKMGLDNRTVDPRRETGERYEDKSDKERLDFRGNVAQLGLATARTFNPSPISTSGFQKQDQQALTSLLSFLVGASLGRIGDRIGAKHRTWLVSATFGQALMVMAAALAAHFSGESGIAVNRLEPSWRTPLGMTALGFISASLGLQGIIGKRVGTGLNTTIVLTTTWVEISNDPLLFSLKPIASRDIRIGGVLSVFLGAFVGRALLGTKCGSPGTLGVLAGLRLIQMVWWGLIPAPALKAK